MSDLSECYAVKLNSVVTVTTYGILFFYKNVISLLVSVLVNDNITASEEI